MNAPGPEIARFVTGLTAPDAAVRLDAAAGLARAGRAAAAVAPDLVRACGNTDEQVRDWSVAAVEGLGVPPGDAVDGLVPLAGSTDPLVAYWAITLPGVVWSGCVGRSEFVGGSAR
ncbi:MAG: hypothetical protein FJ284_07450 [Planctomycetes bacterium]|nr:hypothetical protein [Planctomycetota bacterium]MBM4058126.1 hypothetical protein [Planctomycetota bacterium]